MQVELLEWNFWH